MLFSCCLRDFVRAFSRLFRHLYIRRRDFLCPERRPEREPDIECEIREKRLARRNFGRAIVFVFFAINYCGFCWRGELLNSYWWTHFAVFLECVVK